MSRKLKETVEGELKSRYGEAREAVVVNVIGLTGVEANKLRGQLRGKKLEMHVVKNRALRRVVASGPLAPLAGALSGPCALITGGTAVETAKESMGDSDDE